MMDSTLRAFKIGLYMALLIIWAEVPCRRAWAAGFSISGGTVTVANAARVKTASDLVINRGSLVANASQFIIGGNWTNTGGFFTAGTSTVTFNGSAAQTVNNRGQSFSILIDSNTSSGGVTFSSSFTAVGLTVNGAGLVSATTVYFNAGSTYSISGLTLVGSNGNRVWIRSSTDNQSWYLNNTSTHNVSYVDVKDSNASPGLTIAAGPKSIDSGNNINWTFLILSISFSTHSYDFGIVNLGATTVSTSAVTIANIGNDTETYSLSVATTGAKTVWAIGTSTPTSFDTLVMFNLFNSVQPSSNTFTSSDVVTRTPTAADSALYAGDETAFQVPVGATRHLWMRLNMPLTTSTTDQQRMNLTATASSP